MVSLKPQHTFWNQAWFQKPLRCFCWFQYGFSETILVSKLVFGPNMAKNEVSFLSQQNVKKIPPFYNGFTWNCSFSQFYAKKPLFLCPVSLKRPLFWFQTSFSETGLKLKSVSFEFWKIDPSAVKRNLWVEIVASNILI